MYFLAYNFIQLNINKLRKTNTINLQQFNNLKIVVIMVQNLTFDQLPTAVTMLTKEVSELKRLLIEKQEQPPTQDREQLLTIDEVAELLHLSKPTVYSKHSKGELPGVCKQGKRLYFERDVIVNWIKSGRKLSNAEIEAEAGSYLKKKGGNNG